MGRKGSRTALAPNIYEDDTGRSGVVRVGPWRKEKRFPPQTPLRVIKDWQHRKREQLGVLPAPAKRGTFKYDVELYMGLVRHLAGWISLRAELRAWLTALPGIKSRHQITEADVRRVRNLWLDAGLKPKTINNRVAALNRMWHTLDGRRSVSPGDDLEPLPTHKTPAQKIPSDVVLKTYQGLLDMEYRGVLRDARTRARFMVMASTGKRPSEVMRAEPGDVDLERRVWTVRDGKGGWGPGIYLNDDMLTAWKVFVEAEAWGTFREGALVCTLRSAGWPSGLRPYNLRHTVGITMSEGGADLADIQAHLGHKRIETTRKHYVPVIGSRLQKASEMIDGRFGWK